MEPETWNQQVGKKQLAVGKIANLEPGTWNMEPETWNQQVGKKQLAVGKIANLEPGTWNLEPGTWNYLKTEAMIHVEKPTPERLEKLGVDSWPIWEKEVSVFPWEYDEKETCYILEGEVEVTPVDGRPVSFGKGDLVIFSEGLKCTWNIKKAVKKHYKFG